MITIISATNRPGSMSEVVAAHYAEMLRAKGAEVQILSLRNLPQNFIETDMYGKRTDVFQAVIDQYLIASDKFVFVIPEYNGSYPGILKAFIDAAHPKYFRQKKAGIIGVSDGHAGNLRGQEHLTGVLHYMRMMVHYAQPKLSDIDHAVNEEGVITNERTLSLLNDHAQFMINF